jgi:isopenicillin N synthase-like dioxygenase
LEEIDNVFYDYLEELCVLGQDLLECCENVLGLREGRLLDNYEAAGSIVDALFYDKTPPGQWGTNAHYDNCMMTILRQDMVGGLELQHRGLWYPVKPMKDCFVVNFGKMMEHFTYGVIKGTQNNLKLF